jgi:hypothetical protein
MRKTILKRLWNKIEPRLNKKIVNGCHENPTPLLTRYKLIQTKYGDLNIHILHRSDEDREKFHDHPWNMVTIILKNGYIEHMPEGDFRRKPFQVLYRPATHAHWVEIIDNKEAITLSIMSNKIQEWGFYTDSGWKHWKNFLNSKGCVDD